MYQNPHERYLENEVLSASPQKLRKMLIDGAIRFCRNAIAAWQEQDFERGLNATDRVRDIFTELLASTQQTAENKTILDVYRFLNHEVTMASFEHSESRMQKVIHVLEVEQETWNQVCQQISGQNPSGAAASQSAPHYPAAAMDYGQNTASGPMSWEA